MKRGSRIAGLAALAALSGCARYHARPIDAGRSAARLTARRLDDPRLDKFLAAMGRKPEQRWGLGALTLVAVYERPDLAIARANFSVARGLVASASALPNPVLSLQPTYNATNGNPSPLKIGPLVSFLIDNFGARQAGIAAARERAAAARQVIATASWAERARVRDALLALWSARRGLELAKRNDALAGAAERTIDQRYRAGMVSSVARNQARLTAEQAGFSLAEAERRKSLARVGLAAALGLPDAALDGVSISTAAFDAPGAPGEMAGLVRTALVARPSVRAALARYQADQEDLRQAIDAQFPGVTIGPGYHYDQGDNKFLLAISLPLPVLNQNQGPIAVARAKRRRAAAQFQAAQLHVLDQVGRAERNYRASAVAEAEADRIAARARVQARAARAAYRAGATGRVRLLGAEQADILARQNALAAEIQVRTALGQLEDGLHHRFFGSGA